MFVSISVTAANAEALASLAKAETNRFFRFILMVSCFLCCSLSGVENASAQVADCSSFKGVYVPYPGYHVRDDGIAYTLTLEPVPCPGNACSKADVQINTVSGKGALLRRLTLDYYYGGNDPIESVSLSPTAPDARGGKLHDINFEPVGVTAKFSRDNFTGSKNHSAHALILGGLERHLNYVDWTLYGGNIKKLSDQRLPIEVENYRFMPEIWVLDHCSK